MAGNNQHYIPQSLLRNFRIGRSTKAKSEVWLFEKGKKAEVKRVKEVAAEAHFYSELSTDQSATLDDLITAYENSFAKLLQSLQSTPFGVPADSACAAKIVAHLIIRNALLRTTMGEGFRELFTQAVEIFSNEAQMRPLLGIDSKVPSQRIAEAVDGEYERDLRFLESGVPKEVVRHIAFTLLKEKFNRFFSENIPGVLEALRQTASDSHQLAGQAHNEALASDFTSFRRVETLSKFSWTVGQAPQEGVILPDCVALGIEKDSVATQPLILADLDKIETVLMPLAADKVLIGRRNDKIFPDIADFNKMAASCSRHFFVSARNGDDVESLVHSIGEQPNNFINSAVASVFSNFSKDRASSNPSEAVRGKEEDLVIQGAIESGEDGTSDEEYPQGALNYSTHFLGCADQETAEKIAANVNAVVVALRRVEPLDRLDGITFAHDYHGALNSLDRGFVTSAPLLPTNEDYAVGVAMAPIVVREGKIKVHIVMTGDIGHALLQEGGDSKDFCLHALVDQLGIVSNVQLLDEALPGFLLSQPADSYNAFLYPYVDKACSGYFTARFSAGFYPPMGQNYRMILVETLKQARKVILPARLAYRFDGDMDRLLQAALPAISAILTYAGKVLGHYAGLGQSAVDDEVFRAALEDVELNDWIQFFDGELSELWGRRGDWSSSDEFFILNHHVERLMWQFGLIPWKLVDGRINIAVPIGTDAAQLSELS